jgi:deoxyhypusine synthase
MKLMNVNKLKKSVLKNPTEPIEVWPEKKISELVSDMQLTGFQGRKLGESFDIWSKMLRRKNIVIWLGLSGAMVPAGMRMLVSYLIKRRMIDVVVSTGANLYHDACEAMGVKHYVGTHSTDDDRLRELRVDRIYDVFADENKYYGVDNVISKEFCSGLKENYPYSTRELLFEFGKFLNKRGGDKNSILISAFKNNVPVFSPALGDSSLGFSIMLNTRPWTDGSRIKTINRRGKKITYKKHKIIIDMMRDVDECSRITEVAKECGVIYIGGGTPKNYINQTTVISSYQTLREHSHKYAIQITTDMPQWGGLSGCTFEESKSWGKFSRNAKHVTCHCDATIALPILTHALSEKFKRLRRNVPVFHWNGKPWNHRPLKVTYEKKTL